MSLTKFTVQGHRYSFENQESACEIGEKSRSTIFVLVVLTLLGSVFFSDYLFRYLHEVFLTLFLLSKHVRYVPVQKTNTTAWDSQWSSMLGMDWRSLNFQSNALTSIPGQFKRNFRREMSWCYRI